MNENLAHCAYRAELQMVLPSTQDPSAAFTCYRETVQEVFRLQLHKPIVRTESAALIGSLPQHLSHPLL